MSCAPTDTYLSPILTPKPNSDVDMTLSAHTTRLDLAQTLEELARAQRIERGGERDEVDLGRASMIEMPRFGDSPGRSPSPSTPSCTTPSEFIISEVLPSNPFPPPAMFTSEQPLMLTRACSKDEDTTSGDEDAEEEVEVFTQRYETAKTSDTKVVEPKTPKPVKEEKSPALPPRPVRKGLADVRIDVKSLQKRAPAASKTTKSQQDGGDEHDHAALLEDLKVS